MHLPEFKYLVPENKAALLLLLGEHQGAVELLSGGTDLINDLKARVKQPQYVVDISSLRELEGLSYEKGKGLTVGAATKLAALERSPVVKECYPALHEGIRVIGSPQIRAMGTIGGNSCNASPCADTPPPLIAYRATVRLASKRGTRELALEDFILGNRMTARQPDEILESFFVPQPWPGSACRFSIVGLREAAEIDLASVAICCALDAKGGAVKELRVVMGSVGPMPLRAVQTEAMLKGHVPTADLIDKAADCCAGEAKPIDDQRASAAYRHQAIRALFTRTFKEVLAALG
ncbi:MAG: xanthine dehydrogenase family protein subunit M [Myxococcota bacterium]|jgi:carbon-monoxide dehydrogenase medium subunit|nr:xanthine dehydrogenase family protein subunit M [Myxococcota bacterium]